MAKTANCFLSLLRESMSDRISNRHQVDSREVSQTSPHENFHT